MKCMKCGYAEDDSVAETTRVVAVDPNRHRCIYVENGMRCIAPGTMSESTHGSEGKDGNDNPKFYCAKHYPYFRGLRHRDTPRFDPLHVSEIEREALAKFPGKEGKAWAHRLIYRHEHGEAVPAYSLSCAYEALGIRQTIDEQETR